MTVDRKTAASHNRRMITLSFYNNGLYPLVRLHNGHRGHFVIIQCVISLPAESLESRFCLNS